MWIRICSSKHMNFDNTYDKLKDVGTGLKELRIDN